MIITMHQPNILPWLGFFYKMAKSDAFLYADTLAFSKGSYTHRVKIKTHNGPRWLTLPVQHTGHVGDRIADLRLGGRPTWRQEIVDAFRGSYLKAPHYQVYADRLAAIIHSGEDRLAEFNIALIDCLADQLGVRTPTLRATEMGLRALPDPTEWIIGACKAAGADTFLSGFGGAKYQEEARFAQEGIRLVYTDFKHPTYPQLHGDFVAGLSVVDLLFNCGPASPRILGI